MSKFSELRKNKNDIPIFRVDLLKLHEIILKLKSAKEIAIWLQTTSESASISNGLRVTLSFFFCSLAQTRRTHNNYNQESFAVRCLGFKVNF